MARYELILRQDGAMWLRIIAGPLLTPKEGYEDPKMTQTYSENTFHLPRWPQYGMDTLTHRILTRHDTEIVDTIDIDTP